MRERWTRRRDRGGRSAERAVAPAVERAVAAGRRYEDIRDTLRQEWKP